MEIYFTITFFIFGLFFGSFYNVVGYRLPKGESLLHPRSHCPNCNHLLGTLELIPVFSFMFQKGKCKNCKQKINPFYPLCELACGLLFALCFWKFGFSKELILALTFVSLVIIVIVSDYNFMIISDEVIILFAVLITLENFLLFGLKFGFNHLVGGVIAFGVMYLVGILGDWLFKKESLGGGDIKLMFIIGSLLGGLMSIVNIFVASFIAFPVACVVLFFNKDHLIPYGPFLAAGALLLFFTQINFMDILMFLGYTPL